MPMSWLRHRVPFALLIAAVAALLAPLTPQSSRSERAAAAGAPRPYIRAAHWFGDDWPVNFWNTDLVRRAPAAFAALREDGFNTVVLLVPWSGFAPNAVSGDLDARRVGQLRTLIGLAREHQLQVVLRLGFAWDAATTDHSRLVTVWTDAAIYQGWLEHLAQLWRAVGDQPNVVLGFISWEDLWAVTGLSRNALGQRITDAGTTGYREWLQATHSLEAVGQRYETQFSDWTAVPLPDARTPAFDLFLDFLDVAWIERFFVPAQKRFPKLSMEVRIDADPVWRDGAILRWHDHTSSWKLPGAEWISIYWSPAMGGANEGETLTPKQAAERLDRRLQEVSAATGARPIFIDQFLPEVYTPGFEHNGRIAKPRVGEFLALAQDILRTRAGGYALWTWRDYAHAGIGNPEFFNGWQGWERSSGVFLVDASVRMGAHTWLERVLRVDDYHDAVQRPVELCVHGRALDGHGATLAVSDEETMTHLGEVSFAAAPSRPCIEFAMPRLMRLRLSAHSEAILTRVQVLGFVESSGMRDVNGKRKRVAADYVRLNRHLLTPTRRSVSLHH
jgi:hypothetical protein